MDQGRLYSTLKYHMETFGDGSLEDGSLGSGGRQAQGDVMSKDSRRGLGEGKGANAVTSAVLSKAASDISQFIKTIFPRQTLREGERTGGRTLTRHFALVISGYSGACCATLVLKR